MARRRIEKLAWLIGPFLLGTPWVLTGCAVPEPAGNHGRSPTADRPPRQAEAVPRVSAAPRPGRPAAPPTPPVAPDSPLRLPAVSDPRDLASDVRLVAWDDPVGPSSASGPSPALRLPAQDGGETNGTPEPIAPSGKEPATTLPFLLQLARQQSPRLQNLREQAAAARARVRYVGKLPDPTVGANFFPSPIETAAGSQRANLTVAQRFPWLTRLDAQERQALFEALALEQAYETELLKVIADVRAQWFRLYVLRKQVEVNQANQQLLESLIRIANARVAAGGASQGDVLLGTLELSRLAEQLLTLRQQLTSSTAELNRIIGRPADVPVLPPQRLDVQLPDWSHDELRAVALRRQPDIAAARLRADATRWGVEVARLQRRPDVTLNASWFAIDDNRPTPNIVDVGQDAWSVGIQMTLPVSHRKYDAIEQEATRRHLASHADVEETIERYDALLLDLLAQARAAQKTADLYRTTILPQANQTLQADQEAYSTGSVEFDRVVRDLRNLLTLQLEYHRSLGRLAIAVARIQQAAGLTAEPPSTPATPKAPETLPEPATGEAAPLK